eukprot:364951-Chlamydomonas_euryale.AAC.4
MDGRLACPRGARGRRTAVSAVRGLERSAAAAARGFVRGWWRTGDDVGSGCVSATTQFVFGKHSTPLEHTPPRELYFRRISRADIFDIDLARASRCYLAIGRSLQTAELPHPGAIE